MPSWIPHARGNQALSAKTPLKTNPLRSGSASGIPLRVQTAHAQTTQSSSADGDNGDANDTAATETIINATIDSFFKGLEPEDQTLFKATTLASQLLQDVQAADKRHHERSTTRRIVVALKPFHRRRGALWQSMGRHVQRQQLGLPHLGVCTSPPQMGLGSG